MRLPNPDKAIIAKAKLTDYLLSSAHPSGRTKARFFADHGFTPANWQQLEIALRNHVTEHDATTMITMYGTKYIVEGPLNTPRKTNPMIRAVWFVETGDDAPRFVTAYPVQTR